MALSDKQEAFLATINPQDRPLFQEAYQGLLSPRQCIRAFCLHCKASNRADVRGCTESVCPLYIVRPFQNSNY